MKKYRFYCEKITKPVSEISGIEAHHLTSVLRLKREEQVELFDGRGVVAEAVIKELYGKKVALEILNIHTVQKRTERRIIIAASIAKGERFDWLIEKCTELGVDRISPFLFERTVKYAAGTQTIQRWHNLSISAAKQSGLNLLPLIDNPAPLKDVLEKLKKDYPVSDVLLGWIDLNAVSLTQYSLRDKDVIALIGPEGGLTDSEKQYCLEADAKPVRLTDSVLRVETAALALASILSTMRQSIQN